MIGFATHHLMRKLSKGALYHRRSLVFSSSPTATRRDAALVWSSTLGGRGGCQGAELSLCWATNGGKEARMVAHHLNEIAGYGAPYRRSHRQCLLNTCRCLVRNR